MPRGQDASAVNPATIYSSLIPERKANNGIVPKQNANADASGKTKEIGARAIRSAWFTSRNNRAHGTAGILSIAEHAETPMPGFWNTIAARHGGE